jgi:N utilization substance protein A
MNITLSKEEIRYMGMAEERTRAKIKDCITGEQIIFIVEKGELGKAIGKGARNIGALSKIFNKKVKFVEYDDDDESFVRNLFKPYKVKKVRINENMAEIEIEQSDKGKAIGKNGRNIKMARKIARRYHGIDLKII